MLRLTRNRKSRVSNRVAIFAALMLTVISLAGAGGPTTSSNVQGQLFTTAGSAEKQVEKAQSNSSSAVKNNKGFKVSLFLFRKY